MRSGLFSDLMNLGYEIFLEGDHIRYRYQKTGNPPNEVKPLIDELRKCKTEILNILKNGNAFTSTEKTQPRADVTAAWPGDCQAIIDWLITLEPPREPFNLEPHRNIVDPAKFFSALRIDIEAGPDGARGKRGALIHDLMTLKKILH
jgi:hypothetical protein